MKFSLLSLIIIFGLVVTACSDHATRSKPTNPPYNISVTVSPAGAGTVVRHIAGPPFSPLKGPYGSGQQVELTAGSAKNYVFEKWTGDIKSDSISLYVTVNKDYSLTAVFQKAKRVHSFHLAKNGITVVCDGADYGTYDIINGKTYVKRKGQQINGINAATTCTSGVTDMSLMFHGLIEEPRNPGFGPMGDISSWDVSNVTDMYDMFFVRVRDMPEDGSDFNQDISHWNVSNVTDMTGMFLNAVNFNQDLSGWCVKNIPSKPKNFSKGSALTPNHEPVWGTCPGK